MSLTTPLSPEVAVLSASILDSVDDAVETCGLQAVLSAVADKCDRLAELHAVVWDNEPAGFAFREVSHLICKVANGSWTAEASVHQGW